MLNVSSDALKLYKPLPSSCAKKASRVRNVKDTPSMEDVKVVPLASSICAGRPDTPVRFNDKLTIAFEAVEDCTSYPSVCA